MQQKPSTSPPPASSTASPAPADATLARPILPGALLAGQPPAAEVTSGEVKIGGDVKALARLAGGFDPPRPDFPIVTR